jgi:hypothetical protein
MRTPVMVSPLIAPRGCVTVPTGMSTREDAAAALVFFASASKLS